MGQAGLRDIRFELDFVEMSVKLTARNQLSVRAMLNDIAALQDENAIGAPNGRKPMGNEKRGASAH